MKTSLTIDEYLIQQLYAHGVRHRSGGLVGGEDFAMGASLLLNPNLTRNLNQPLAGH